MRNMPQQFPMFSIPQSCVAQYLKRGYVCVGGGAHVCMGVCVCVGVHDDVYVCGEYVCLGAFKLSP